MKIIGHSVKKYYKLKRVLGAGTYGKVYEASQITEKSEDKENCYAVKEINMLSMDLKLK